MEEPIPVIFGAIVIGAAIILAVWEHAACLRRGSGGRSISGTGNALEPPKQDNKPWPKT